jgi:hypothetical protein
MQRVTTASLAQLVERGTSNAEVTGSTPLGGIVLTCFAFFFLTTNNLCVNRGGLFFSTFHSFPAAYLLDNLLTVSMQSLVNS